MQINEISKKRNNNNIPERIRPSDKQNANKKISNQEKDPDLFEKRMVIIDGSNVAFMYVKLNSMH